MQKVLMAQHYEVVITNPERPDAPLYRVAIATYSEDEAKEEALRLFRSNAAVMGWREPPNLRVEVLSGAHLDPRKKQQSLFEEFAHLCADGRYSMQDIQGAAVNLLLVGVQRSCRTLAEAERRWDELAGRGREALRRRYTGETDRRDVEADSELGKRLISS